MPVRQLKGLRAQAYEHPLDRDALGLLQKTTGLETVVRKLNEIGFERLLRAQLTGSYLRATADTFPEVHAQLVRACATLEVPVVPDLYIAPGGDINAFTAGVERPLIVLNSGAVDLLTPDELYFVLGHEVGHVKSAHVLYYQMAEFLPVISDILGSATFGIGDLVSLGLRVALVRWKRTSEFTADRAGLLACQDLNVVLTTLVKLAGLPQKHYRSINTEDFIAQARAFEALDADKLNWLAKMLAGAGATHPWTVLRAKQALEWVDGGGYDQVLAQPHVVPIKLPTGVTGFCAGCGFALKGGEVFCPGCGKPVEAAKGLVK